MPCVSLFFWGLLWGRMAALPRLLSDMCLISPWPARPVFFSPGRSALNYVKFVSLSPHCWQWGREDALWRSRQRKTVKPTETLQRTQTQVFSFFPLEGSESTLVSLPEVQWGDFLLFFSFAKKKKVVKIDWYDNRTLFNNLLNCCCHMVIIKKTISTLQFSNIYISAHWKGPCDATFTALYWR